MREYLVAVIAQWWNLVGGLLLTRYGIVGWRWPKADERLGYSKERFFRLAILGVIVAQALAWFDVRSKLTVSEQTAQSSLHLYQASQEQNRHLNERNDS